MPRAPTAAPGLAPSRPGLAPWQVGKILRHIDAHLAEDMTVSRLAGLLGLSAGYFSRAFRARLDSSPHAFILDRRLERARALMLGSTRGLSEIALECGFCDQPHLTKRFRQALGTSPAAWRRHHGEEESSVGRWEAGRAPVGVPAERRAPAGLVLQGREGARSSKPAGAEGSRA